MTDKKNNREKLNIRENSGVTYVSFPSFERQDWLISGMSTKLGGVSSGCCESMNLRLNDIDTPENIARNYELFCKAIGTDVNKVAFAEQVHGTKIGVITNTELCEDIYEKVKLKKYDFPETDGLTTNIPGITIFTFSADCSVITIADPVHKAVGQCHAGWKGTKGKIVKNLLETMNKEYGTNPSDVIAAVNPSICQDCYEVSSDVIEEFKEAFPSEIWPQLFYEKQNGKYQLDILEANRQVMLSAGVKPECIYLPNLCSKCNNDLFYSHRISGLSRGVQAAFICIK